MMIPWYYILHLQPIQPAHARVEITSMTMVFAEQISRPFWEQKNGFIM